MAYEQYRMENGSAHGGPNFGKRFFDDKAAHLDCFKFILTTREKWASGVRNYIIGRCPCAKVFLKWIEDQQHAVISEDAVAATRYVLMMETDPSQQIWAWLNLSLQHDTDAMIMFDNVESLSGAEIWRNMVTDVNKRFPELRYRLRGEVRSPVEAAKFGEAMTRIEAWEGDNRKFVLAGGTRPSDEDMRVITLDLLPPELPFHVVSGPRQLPTFSGLKTRFHAEVEYYKDGAGKLDAKPILIVEERSTMLAAERDGDDDSDGEVQMVMDEVNVSRESAMEIIAYMKGKGKFKQRFQPGRQGILNKAQKDRRQGAPRDSRDVRCGKCGETGHDSRGCSKSRTSSAERECVKCGKLPKPLSISSLLCA